MQIQKIDDLFTEIKQIFDDNCNNIDFVMKASQKINVFSQILQGRTTSNFRKFIHSTFGEYIINVINSFFGFNVASSCIKSCKLYIRLDLDVSDPRITALIDYLGDCGIILKSIGNDKLFRVSLS